MDLRAIPIVVLCRAMGRILLDESRDGTVVTGRDLWRLGTGA
jgi:hypothetical protein